MSCIFNTSAHTCIKDGESINHGTEFRKPAVEMSRESSAVYRLQAFPVFIIVAAIVFGAADGKPPTRIVGGSDAPLGEIIFQASLRIHGKHRCGGTLVSTRHVITAAHCVYDIDAPYRELTAVTGTNSLAVGGEHNRVKDIDVYANFTSANDGSWHDDIAVITLDGDIQVNTYQAPISMPDDDDDAPPRSVGLVSGWGYKEFEDFPDGEFSTILQKSDMTILSNEECQEAHKSIIDDGQICGFKDNYIGTCKGDGGSPLVYNGVVVGISSWYYPCGLGLPDVYTRVHHYLPWILDVISRSFYEDFGDLDQFANFADN